MRVDDLIGKPYAEMRCLAAVLEVLRRMGRDVPASAEEAAARWGNDPGAAWRKLGTSVAAVERVGDVVHTEPAEGREASVFVLVSGGRALTSTPERGVCIVRLRDIPEPLTVWRLYGTNAQVPCARDVACESAADNPWQQISAGATP